MNVRETVEKRQPSHNVPWDVNCHHYYGEWYGGSLYKLKIELLYSSAMPLLGIYAEKIIIQKEKCTPVFISLLIRT